MSRQLVTTVALVDPDGSVRRFGPGDDVPLEYAERITNPDVWDSPSDAVPASSTAPAAEGDAEDDEDTDTSADGPRKSGRRRS